MRETSNVLLSNRSLKASLIDDDEDNEEGTF